MTFNETFAEETFLFIIDTLKPLDRYHNSQYNDTQHNSTHVALRIT